jgi:PAS domain S-box-containing protein
MKVYGLTAFGSPRQRRLVTCENAVDRASDDRAPWLPEEGEMGQLIRRFDWSDTTLGPIGQWPQALRTSVSICLQSRFPLFVQWGPELVLIYNDAYTPILGAKHPALGQPMRVVWSDIWDVIGPMLGSVVATGRATWMDDQLLVLNRYGYREDAYFIYSYSPIRGDLGTIEGIFTAVVETTDRVVGGRRWRTLRDLASRALEQTRNADAACRAAAATLAENASDVPFALIYLLDADRRHVRLVAQANATAGVSSASEIPTDDPDSPVAAAARTGAAAVLDVSRWPGVRLEGGNDVPREMVILPIAAPGQALPTALLVAGINPRRPMDDAYHNFFRTAATHVATALAHARAYEEERRRAEALAEIDRVKTTFFTNVSHELRTPLTLMLAPIDDLLQRADLPPGQRPVLEVVHRNGIRLQKLVNTLLDFSRIEAGRMRGLYERTDIAALTADLASAFRAAVEAAGMRLVVDAPSVEAPVFVDRDMWEKIVLNLLSNALKFTLEGEIVVRIRELPDAVELTVTDTGIGIPAAELQRIFSRFHRVERTRGRSHEGTGIGLAVVHELVGLHNGTVAVESTEGKETTFRVIIPSGSAHLPSDRIGHQDGRQATSLHARHFVEEALQWLPDRSGPRPETPRPESSRRSVLIADDNADMRRYLERLLAGHFDVESVTNGALALDAIRRRRPDLVLTDVMMPEVDGFALLERIREDPRLRDVPVVILSARAGEEARIEGAHAGADDYIVKPFAARELVARVSAQIEIARAREQAVHALRGSEELLRIATRTANLFTWEVDVSTGRTSASGNVTDIIGFPLPADLAGAFEIIHPADREQVIREYEEAITLGRPFHSDQRLLNPHTGEIVHMRVDAALISDGAAGRSRLVGISRNVTEERLAEEALRISEERVRLATEAAGVYTWELDLETGAIVNSANAERVRGTPPPHNDEQGHAGVHPDDLLYVTERRAASIRTGELLDIEYRTVDRQTGAITWLRAQGNVIRDESGNPRRLVGVVQNVTVQKSVEEALRRSTEELEQRVQERTAELRCSTEALETLLEDRASLMRQLVRAEEEERQRIARELHDELGQPLTALQVGLGTLSTDSPDELRRLIETVAEIDRNVERLAFDLRPLALTELGLEAAIAHLVEKFQRESDVDVDLHVEIVRERLEGAVETTLYRILQEALTNVWRHSGAASVSVIVDRRHDHLQMIVEDDGHGFDVQAVLQRRDGRRFGLLGIRERVSLVGGTFDIESGQGSGTTLYVRVPLEREGEA